MSTNESTQAPMHAFLTAAALLELARKIEETQTGLVTHYDASTGSLAVLAVVDGATFSWSITGPMGPEQAQEEIAAAEAHANPGRAIQ